MVARNGALAVFCCALLSAGCSLILDPKNCSDESDCSQGRSCQSGICIGPGEPEPAPQPDAMPEPEPDATVQPEPDARVEPEPDAMVEPDSDAMVEPDAAPMKAPPSCEITVPVMATVGPLSVEDVLVEGIVTDVDTMPGALTVTLAGQPVTLTDNGMFSMQVPVAEGPNVIRLEARDPDDQSCTAQVSVRVDRTGPTVVILNPNNDLVVNPERTPFRVSGTVDDASMVAAVRATLDGNPIADVNFEGGEFSFSVELREGDNVIAVVAEDVAGNVAEAVTRTIGLDSTPPVVSLDAPIDGTRTPDATTRVIGQVETEGVGERRANIGITVNGDAVELPVPDRVADNDGRFNFEVALVVGANRIEVTGDDAAGNDATAAVTVTRDDPAPCVDIESPDDGGFVNAPQVELSGTVCPAVDRVELRIGAAVPIMGEVVDGRFTATVQLTPGSREVTVRALTPANASAEDRVTVTYDDTAPTIRLNQPINGACSNANVIRACGLVEDPESGISTVRVNGTDAALQDANFCADLILVDGTHSITIVATNAAGTERRAPALGLPDYTVRVDRDPPVVVLQGGDVRPWLGVDAFEEVRLRGSAEGGLCGPTSATWERVCDGEVPADLDCLANARQLGLQNGGFTIRSALPDGERLVRVSVTDEAGNQGEAIYNFRVDSVEPEIADRTPDQFSADDQFEVCVTGLDLASGVTIVNIDGADAPLAPAGGGQQGCRTLALEEGRNAFNVRVEDLVGNRAFDIVTITRDTTPPVAEVAFPAEFGAIAVPTSVSGTVNDGEGSGVTRVDLRIGDRRFATVLANGGWRAGNIPVDPASPSIFVIATDALGNEIEFEHVVIVPAYVDLGVNDGFGVDSDASTLLLLDADLDGLPDVLSLSDAVDGASALYLQRADGSFSARFDDGLPNAPIQAADLADVNADGTLDLVISSGGATRLLLGDGNGAFVETAAGLPNIGANDLKFGDMNADGHADLVLLAGLGSRIQFGDGTGNFNSQNLEDLGLEDIVDYTNAFTVDLDGDGNLDLLLLSSVGSAFFTGGIPFSLMEAPNLPGDRAAALDLDRDGDLDLFTNEPGAGRFIVQTAGGFAQGLQGVVFGAGDRGVTVGDLDGDARTDVVVYGDAGLRAYRGAADGFVLADLGLPVLTDVRSAQIADMDGDGDQDIIYATVNGTGLVRSNTTALDPEYRYTRLDIRRGDPGPIDALGAVIGHEYAPGLVRRVVALSGIPTIVTLLGNDVEVLVDFIGGGRRTVPALVSNPDPIVAPAP
ncbi:MAG: hypothetical protein ACI9U2_002623 [Bradymonadia bacterium]|jgi:hypothetical protein